MAIRLFQTNDDFFTDRLVRRYSVIIFITIAVILFLSLSNPNGLTCQYPSHFSGSMVQFGQATCWSSGLFQRLPDDVIPNEDVIDGRDYNTRKIRYLPLVLILQIFFFLLPRAVWKLLTKLIGFSTDRFMNSAEQVWKKENDSENRMQSLGAHALSLLRHPFPLLGKTLSAAGGYVMYSVYMLSKIGYSMVCIIQFSILGAFLNLNLFAYGFGRSPWSSYARYTTYKDGNDTLAFQTDHFPRSVMCEYKVRRLGNVQRYSIQCDIASSALIEFMLFVIWAWLWICICLLSISTFAWMLRFVAYLLSPQAYQLNRMGTYLGRKSPSDDKTLKSFTKLFLKPDGCLLLEMIEENVSFAAAAQLVKAAWLSYREDETGQSEFSDRPSSQQRAQTHGHGGAAGGPQIYPKIEDPPSSTSQSAPSYHDVTSGAVETVPLMEKSSL